ncbi:MAG: glycerophosphodiester phosphodiesterase [Desulfuromonas sp.]|nr:MAG: glycerophosphodiester phosphodiesterase [Desulfuromonas sp.]
MLCFAHRGARGHAPENTLSAMRTALELGAPWVEIDVFLVDDELVVFHDERLERTTNGNGLLQKKSFAELRQLDAGNGEQIPTLDEVCACIDRRAGINIELKGGGCAEAVATALERWVAQGWNRDDFLVSSFDHRQLQQFHRLAPEVRIGALHCSLPIDDACFAEELDAYSVHPSIEFVDERFVADAHRRGLKVYVYTVNYYDDIARMVQLGVDGVFSDYPERILSKR